MTLMNGYDENQVLKFVVLQAENKGKTNEHKIERTKMSEYRS